MFYSEVVLMWYSSVFGVEKYCVSVIIEADEVV